MWHCGKNAVVLVINSLAVFIRVIISGISGKMPKAACWNYPSLFKWQFIFLFSRQGKVRLQKWYNTFPAKEKKKIVRELLTTILARRPKMCSFLEYKDMKICYKRYCKISHLFGTWKIRIKYSRMDQVKFVEDSLYPFKFLKGRLSQISLGPFLNTLSHFFH